MNYRESGRLTGAFAEAAFKPYVLYITYSDSVITW